MTSCLYENNITVHTNMLAESRHTHIEEMVFCTQWPEGTKVTDEAPPYEEFLPESFSNMFQHDIKY